MSPGRDSSTSPSSNEKALASRGDDNYKAAPRHVRTIPTWVRSFEEVDEDVASPLPLQPLPVMIQQDGIPSTSKSKHKHESVRGRLLDTYRELVPPTPHAHVTEMGSRWRAFADASAYPPTSSSEAGQQVTEDWLVQNGTDYSKPWRAAQSREEKGLRARGLGTKVKRQIWWERSQRIVMRSPVIPLVIRTIVWGFSLIALALGASIYRHVRSNREISLEVEESSINQGTSPEMAIIVDAFALVYLVYITYDEYTGKPLGLRSAKAKVRLIFLDLFFIVFDSANLSLAFEALSVPPTGPEKDKLHSQQKALASVLLIALLAWLMTFSISVLRLIEKVVRQ